MPGRSGGRRDGAHRPSGELPPGDPVRARIEARRGDPDVRWHMSRHTLELALGALEEGMPARYQPSGKSRRRRRHKRLL